MAIAVPYLNENSLINYPLAQDQDVPDEIKRLIVDAAITFCMPFYCTPVLRQVEVTSPSVLTITIGSLESLDQLFVITATDFRHHNIFSHYYVARVSGDCGETPSGGENQNYLSPTICIVIDDTVVDTLRETGYSFNGSLQFDPHAISYEPLRFEKLVLENYKKPPIEIYPTSYRQIWFRGGNNVSIAKSDNGIIISADPGAGEGKVPCPESDPADNGLSGNVQIVGDGCISVEPSPADPKTFIVRDSCVACCQCSQYVQKVNTLKRLANELSLVGTSIKDNIDKLNSEITKFNQQGCEDSEGQWIEILSAAGNNPGAKGRARIFAVLSITNMTCQPGWVTMELPNPNDKLLYFDMEISEGVYADIEPNSTYHTIGHANSNYEPTNIDEGARGLPVLVKVNPGETLKVSRIFIAPKKIAVFPWVENFSGIIKTKGMIRLSRECNLPWQPNYKNFDFKKDLSLR